jgi:hypothetical protein
MFLVINAVITYSKTVIVTIQNLNTLQVGHFLTRFAHASQSTECPQGLKVTTVFVLQTKHWTDASREKKCAIHLHDYNTFN